MERFASYRNSAAESLATTRRPSRHIVRIPRAILRSRANIRTGAGLRNVLAAIALLTASCGPSRRSVATDVPFSAWDRPVEMAFDNDDTTSLCDLTLFLRCNDRFAEDTLTVRIEIRTPDSLRYEEPFILAIPHTNSPAALVREAAIPYRRHVRFERPGQYFVRIAPARTIRGVEAVGLDIADNE